MVKYEEEFFKPSIDEIRKQLRGLVRNEAQNYAVLATKIEELRKLLNQFDALHKNLFVTLKKIDSINIANIRKHSVNAEALKLTCEQISKLFTACQIDITEYRKVVGKIYAWLTPLEDPTAWQRLIAAQK